MVGLIKRVDEMLSDNKGMKAFVVALGDQAAFEEKLAKIAEENGITNVPLTVAVDGSNGPKRYKLDKDTKTTVLYYSKKTVKKAWALDEVTEADIEAVVKAVEAG